MACWLLQGLRDGPYLAATGLWQMAVYCGFLAVLLGAGTALGLKLFTLNDYGVQVRADAVAAVQCVAVVQTASLQRVAAWRTTAWSAESGPAQAHATAPCRCK